MDLDMEYIYEHYVEMSDDSIKRRIMQIKW